MVLLPVKCPVYNGIDVTKHGTTSNSKQRFICKDPVCEGKMFILDYSAKGRLLETKQQIVEMTLNGSGIRVLAGKIPALKWMRCGVISAVKIIRDGCGMLLIGSRVRCWLMSVSYTHLTLPTKRIV